MLFGIEHEQSLAKPVNCIKSIFVVQADQPSEPLDRLFLENFSQAKILQEEAVEGLTRLIGLYHEDTLDAIDWLGQTLLMFYTKEHVTRARQLFVTASEGMEK